MSSTTNRIVTANNTGVLSVNSVNPYSTYINGYTGYTGYTVNSSYKTKKIRKPKRASIERKIDFLFDVLIKSNVALNIGTDNGLQELFDSYKEFFYEDEEQKRKLDISENLDSI